MTRKVTRRQAKAWLDPMRKCFTQMQSGYADSARGYAVTRLQGQDDYVRTDQCIAGFVGLIRRLFPDLDTSAMSRIQRRLASGVLVSRGDLTETLRLLKTVESKLITKTVAELQSAVTTEEIQIELDAIRNEHREAA
jgi:hypothetical protein